MCCRWHLKGGVVMLNWLRKWFNCHIKGIHKTDLRTGICIVCKKKVIGQ